MKTLLPTIVYDAIVLLTGSPLVMLLLGPIHQELPPVPALGFRAVFFILLASRIAHGVITSSYAEGEKK